MTPFRNPRRQRTPQVEIPQQQQRNWIYKAPGFSKRFDDTLALPEEGHELKVRRCEYKHMVVDFAINQVFYVDGVPIEVARIDCSGGSVHRHQFLRSTGGDLLDHELLIVIPQRRPYEVVDEWYDRSMDMMQYGWNGNVERWDDVEGQ